MATTSPSTFQGDWFVNGQLSCKTFTPPAGSITDAAIAAAAGIQAVKCQREYTKVYAQGSTVTAAAETRVLHIVYGGTATLPFNTAWGAGSVTPCTGNATVTLTLKRNGTTIANSTITLTSSSAAYGFNFNGAFVSPAMVNSDILEAVIAVNVGTGVLALGVWCVVAVREDPF